MEEHHVKDNQQERMTQRHPRSSEQSESAPYIRERIVKRRSWREYLFMAAIGIILAMVMGLSVGAGVAWFAPLLNHSVSNPGDEKESDDSTEERLQSTEGESTSQSESASANDNETDNTAGTSGRREDVTESGQDIQPSGIDADLDGLTEEELRRLIAEYVNSQSASADMGQISEAMKALYSQVDTYYLTVRVTTSVDSLVAETDISALMIQVTDTSLNLLVNADEVARAIGLEVLVENVGYAAVQKSSDSLTGLTLLTADISGMKPEVRETLKPAKLGSETASESGDILIAAGSPMGFAGSFQCGMMTGTTVYEEEQDMHLSIIYTDMTVASNQTGSGFLWNLEGEAVGWINSDYQSTGAYAHVLTAVAIDDVIPAVNKLLEGTGAAYLGVRGQNISEQMARDNGLEAGIYVREVTVNSPAYGAGIQSGDIICGVDGAKVLTMEELTEVLAGHSPGDTVQMVVMRWNRDGYTEMKVKLDLGNRM